MTDRIADDRLERARRHVEAHLFEPLTLDRLAFQAGLSAYHFSRQFAARFGISPMAYVRAHRLMAAAGRLLSTPAPALIDLAFDCGFDSQEAFSRAFKRTFGIPPGHYRRSGAHPAPMEDSLMQPTVSRAVLTQSPAPVQKGALRIAGISAEFDETTKAGIPALWQRLVAAVPPDTFAGAQTYGVCSGIPGGEPGSMRYLAGIGLASDAPAPKGLEVVEIAPQSYLIFRQLLNGGDIHQQMQAAAREIWGERLPRSGHRLAQTPDLEVYPPGFRPDQPGNVEWWIPVESE